MLALVFSCRNVDIKLIARISAGAGGWSMEEYMEVNREDYVRKESAKESL